MSDDPMLIFRQSCGLDTGVSDNNYQTTAFDAANRQKQTVTRYQRRFGPHTVWRYEDGITEYYGGDGRSEKSVQTTQTISPASGVYSETNYRIWSSVLGQPLTEADSTGQKKVTNVYAGGAVIGAQGRAPNGNESVGWTVADPVTGSRPQHELEPFGQEIGGPVPATDDDPYANSAPFSPAEEPQWMCGLYDQSHFWNSPVQCQIAAIQIWQGPELVSADQPNNPSKLANFVDSPLTNLSLPDSLADETMSLALSPTKKKKKSYLNIGHLADVTVHDDGGPAIDMTSTPGADASTGMDDDKEYREMSRPTIRLIVDAVKQFLASAPACADRINRVLSELSKEQHVKLYGDINYYLDSFARSGTLYAAVYTPANGGWSMGGGNAIQIDYGTVGWGFSWAASSSYKYTPAAQYTVFLGELIHAIGHRNGKSRFSDTNGANAFANLGIGISLQEFRSQREKQGYKPDPNFTDTAASDLFHGVLQSGCYPKESSGVRKKGED